MEYKDRGQYEAAQSALRPFLKRIGNRPQTRGLHASVAAELLLCSGILTGWVGSQNHERESQESAKNIITEAITYYESIGDVKIIASARAEIDYCYYLEGGLDEARIMLTDALQTLTAEGKTRARALLKLATVEWSASRHNAALRVLEDNAPLFEKINDNISKGDYHNQLAIILRHLAKSE